MKVKYGETIYEFEGDLDCKLFKSLLEEGHTEIELTLYEDIFKLILENKINFEYHSLKRLKEGLDYFGSKYNVDEYYKEKIRNEKEEEMKKYIVWNTIDPDIVARNTALSEKFLDWYISFESPRKLNSSFWISISFHSNLSLYFLEKYKNKLHFGGICQNENIPIEFFENNIDKINWTELAKNSKIPFSFFQKHDKEAVYNLANPKFFEVQLKNKLTDLLSK